jgi:hypothetical protein
MIGSSVTNFHYRIKYQYSAGTFGRTKPLSFHILSEFLLVLD